MNKSIDVLAALRQIANDEGDAQVLAMRVHAVVSDLIEADEELLQIEYGKKFLGRGATNIIGAIKMRHRNALARAKGA